jgi:hypothetical protein
MERLATEKNFAPMLTRGPCQGVHEGGFSCAIAAQKRQSFPLAQRKMDAIQNHGFTITCAQVFNTQQLSHGSPPRHIPDTPL